MRLEHIAVATQHDAVVCRQIAWQGSQERSRISNIDEIFPFLYSNHADQMDVRVRHICATQVDLIPKVRQQLVEIVVVGIARPAKMVSLDASRNSVAATARNKPDQVSALLGFVGMLHSDDYFSSGMSFSKIPERFRNLT